MECRFIFSKLPGTDRIVKGEQIKSQPEKNVHLFICCVQVVILSMTDRQNEQSQSNTLTLTINTLFQYRNCVAWIVKGTTVMGVVLFPVSEPLVDYFKFCFALGLEKVKRYHIISGSAML